jgi:hypothetical protein
MPRRPSRTKFIVAVIISVAALIFIGSKLLASPGAPNLAPMKHFKSIVGDGCFAAALMSCQATYYYVSPGSLPTVAHDVYNNLSKNPNYDVEWQGEDFIYVTYRNVGPNEQDITKKGFGVEFVVPPKSSDQYHGSFINAPGCSVGSTDCVEAEIIK